MACDSISTVEAGRRLRRAAPLILMLLVTACGSTPEPAQDQVEPFLGVWRYEASDAMLTCGDPRIAISDDFNGIEILLTAVSNMEIELMTGSSCRLRLRVQGSVASAREAQPCRVHVEDTITSHQYSFFELTLEQPDLLHHVASGTSVLRTGEGELECPESNLTGTLRRRPVPDIYRRY